MNGFFYEWETRQRQREALREAERRRGWHLEGGVLPRRDLLARFRRAEAAPATADDVAPLAAPATKGPVKKAS